MTVVVRASVAHRVGHDPVEVVLPLPIRPGALVRERAPESARDTRLPDSYYCGTNPFQSWDATSPWKQDVLFYVSASATWPDQAAACACQKDK